MSTYFSSVVIILFYLLLIYIYIIKSEHDYLEIVV